MTADPKHLRLSVSLAGGAALGAYHAGVLAGLLTGVQTLRGTDAVDVRVAAIGGASAGALASMFAAHALMHGLDPVELLYDAWVEQVSLDLLQERGSRAPLGFHQLRDRLPHDLRVDRWTQVPGGPQATPIGLHVSLTGLRGLRYWLRTADDRRIPGVTYADWGEFYLQPGGGVQQLLTPKGASVLDFVLASAANPAAFAPELLDRSHDHEAFAARDIEELPADGRLWYTDGSSISSEPVGRVLKLATGADDDPTARHVCLLVDPMSEAPADDAAWTADGDPPSWLDGVKRTLSIMPEQVLHDDLRRTQHTNRRFERLDAFVDALANHVDADATEALRAAFGDQTDIAAEADARTVLRSAAARVAGLDGKVPVHLDLISPLLLTERYDRPVAGLLAGEIMGDFGGFVHKRLRRSDFVLGYESVLEWMPSGLERTGLASGLIDEAVGAVGDAQPAPWSQVDAGRADASSLGGGARRNLAQLSAHTLRVIGTDIWRRIRP